MEEVMDTRLQRMLRNKIKRDGLINQFKAIYYCGSQVAHVPGLADGVYLLANEKHAAFFGTTTCKSPWACPVCTAKRMSKYATEIACAIDALKQQGQVAFMLTLTVPHHRFMSCEETTEILYNAWKQFIIHGNKRSNLTNNNKKKPNKVWKSRDVFASFCEEFNCIHRVRVCEYTWGKHGWHPHFHCLFWVDKAKLQQVADWEQRLNERWLALTRHYTLKQWHKMRPEKFAQDEIRIQYLYSKKYTNGVSQGAYISKDKNGKVITQESSMYICGWGADKELTGNIRMKATGKGHFTPHQILENAYKAKTTDDAEKWLNLFVEYMTATKKYRHARVNFSIHSGIKEIIRKWKLTNQYAETLKKKATFQMEDGGRWQTVFFFASEEWYSICTLDETMNIKAELLKLAVLEDARRRIIDYLAQFNIDVSKARLDPTLSKAVEQIWHIAA